MIYQILEQTIICDKKPRFVDLTLVMAVLNHNAYSDIEAALDDDVKVMDIRQYKVKLTIEYELDQ